MTTNEMYQTLEEMIVQSSEVIDVMVAIYGDDEETYNNILYAKTGYRNFEQFFEDF